jgi:protein O-mannosyl-transferase
LTEASTARWRAAFWALLGGTVLVYAWALPTPFQFDDRGVILRETSVHSLGAALASSNGLRPLLKLSYALCWAVGAGSPFWFHAFNLLVHLLNVVLVLRLYSAASAPSARWPFRAGLEPGALLAGLVFALHPIQTEAVTYVSGRSASLATTFLLLALLLYAHGVRTGRKLYWLGLTSLAFVAAVATKETSGSLPLGLFAWDLCVERAGFKAAFKRLAPWLAIASATGVALVMHPRYFSLLYDVLGQRSLADALRFQLAGLLYLVERLLLLAPLCIDPGLWLAPPGWVVSGLTAGATTLALGLAVWRKQYVVAFGLIWFLLQVFVPFVLLPRMDVINERHAYVGNAGLVLGFGVLGAATTARLGAWPRAGLAAALALLLATCCVRRNVQYASEVTLWQNTVKVAAKNPRAQNNLGVAYELAGRMVEARLAYTRALVLEPRYVAARDNLRRSTQREQSP